MQEVVCSGCAATPLVPQRAFSVAPQETEARLGMRDTWVAGTW